MQSLICPCTSIWKTSRNSFGETNGKIFQTRNSIRTAKENSLITTESLVFMDLQKLAQTAFEAVPDAQIVLIVRNPAAWLKSQYTHVIMNGRPLDQEHAAEQMLTARFVRMFDIQAYLDAFTTHYPASQVHLIPFEMLRADPDRFVSRFVDWLGVDFRPYLYHTAPNERPPPKFLALLDRVNRIIHETAPQLEKNDTWTIFREMVVKAFPKAHELEPFFEKYYDTLGVEPFTPDLTDEQTSRFEQLLEPLRFNDDFWPYLDQYGLKQG